MAHAGSLSVDGLFSHHRVKYEKSHGGKSTEITGNFFPSALKFILIKTKNMAIALAVLET